MIHQLSDKIDQVLNEFLLYVDEMKLIRAKRFNFVTEIKYDLDLQQQVLPLIDLILANIHVDDTYSR